MVAAVGDPPVSVFSIIGGDSMGKKLTHVDEQGRARMVDVGEKPITRREALAEGRVILSADAYGQLVQNRLAKGDALAVARVAGIQAAKRTADWIPLCHTIPLHAIEVNFEMNPADRTVRVTGRACADWTTGVEMEALVAVSAACLSLYDMTKAVDRGVEISSIRLLTKSGGQSGNWSRATEK